MVTASYIIRILLFLVILPAESVGAREDDFLLPWWVAILASYIYGRQKINFNKPARFTDALLKRFSLNFVSLSIDAAITTVLFAT